MSKKRQFLAKGFEYIVLWPLTILFLILYFPVFILAGILKQTANLLLLPVESKGRSLSIYGKLQDKILELCG